MKFSELKNLPKEELKRLLIQNRERLKDLTFNLSFGKIKDSSQIKKTKKIIARILTLLNQEKNDKKF
jgi:large subunit ribosomal protein L29